MTDGSAGRRGSDDGGVARRPTLADVASRAGVSLATASKALNGRAEVRAATRERVRLAAEEIGFEPNGLAQGLAGQRSDTVGLLTSDLIGRFSLPILMGAEDAFGAGQVSVFLCDARGDTIREKHHLRALLRRQVDGLIVVGSSTDPRPPVALDVPVPVVYAYAPSLSPADLSVVPDNVGGGRLAVEHMITIGRRHIAHLAGDPVFAATRDRAEGVLGGLRDAGLTLAGGRVFSGAWSEAWGRSAMSAALAADPGIDAVVCANDQIARGAIELLQRRGVHVPGDVAVIGFDNWGVVTDGSDPSLTSVDMNLEGLGRRAADLLASAINGDRHQGVESLPCRVVVRGSSLPGGGSEDAGAA